MFYICAKTSKMKQLKFALIFIALLFINNAVAQEATVPEPDFINVPAYFVKGTSDLKNFTKENATIKSKVASAYYDLEGTASNTRIKSSDDYILIVKAGDMDPSNSVILYRLEVKKKKRSALLGTGSITGKVDMSGSKVNYTLEKLSGKVFKIVPSQKLEPGEYLFQSGMNFYTFGID